MNIITLNKIYVSGRRVEYYYSVTGDLQRYFKKFNCLFLEYNYDMTDVPESILTIPFVAFFAPFSWMKDSSIIIRQLDQSFYESLDSLKSAYQQNFPENSLRGNIQVKHIVDNTYMPLREAACIFNGSVNCLSTYLKNKQKNPLLIFQIDKDQEEGPMNENAVLEFENAINYINGDQWDNIFIQSNYRSILNTQRIKRDFKSVIAAEWWSGLHQDIASVANAIPIAFKLYIDCIYFASSHSQSEVRLPRKLDYPLGDTIKFASGTVIQEVNDVFSKIG